MKVSMQIIKDIPSSIRVSAFESDIVQWPPVKSSPTSKGTGPFLNVTVEMSLFHAKMLIEHTCLSNGNNFMLARFGSGPGVCPCYTQES